MALSGKLGMDRHIQSLQTWMDGLAPRERRMVVWGGIGVACLVFFGGIVTPLYGAVGKTAQRVEQKQKDLGWMRSIAGELRAAGPVGAVPTSGQSLILIVDETAQRTGLGQSLTGSQPSGTGGLRVRIEGASFDSLVGWLAMLEQQHQVTVESATVDRTPEPGVVNASISLRKPG